MRFSTRKGKRKKWRVSSVGRASDSRSGGQAFKSPTPHFFSFYFTSFSFSFLPLARKSLKMETSSKKNRKTKPPSICQPLNPARAIKIRDQAERFLLLPGSFQVLVRFFSGAFKYPFVFEKIFLFLTSFLPFNLPPSSPFSLTTTLKSHMEENPQVRSSFVTTFFSFIDEYFSFFSWTLESGIRGISQ